MNELQTTSSEIPFSVRPNRYSAKNNVKPVSFYCHAPQAKAVCLIGDFNNWEPVLAAPMERQPDGAWTAQVELHHGHHQYVFLVDGEPVLDPHANGIARNEKGGRVSLIAVS